MARFHVTYLEAARKRREQAKKLRAEGLSYGQIGKRLNVTRQRAFAMVNPEQAQA
jgi:DNA-binding CsgD family transcriptional regulator